MKIVTISGANKDIGKSSLAAYVIEHCRDCSAAKFTMHEEQPQGPPIVAEQPGEKPGSDTARMMAAGADPVLWVRSTPATLDQEIEEALARMTGKVAVLEGNSILGHLQSDYAIFIMNPTFEDFKPSAWLALERADVVLVNGSQPVDGEAALLLERRCKEHNPRVKMLFSSDRGREAAWSIILSRIVGRVGGEHFVEDLDPRIVEKVQQEAVDGRIACGVALKIAEELGVPSREVGRTANQLKIKIANCSLGCF